MNKHSIFVRFLDCLRIYCQPMYERLRKPLNQEILDQISDPNLRQVYAESDGIAYEIELPTNAFDITGFGVISPYANAVQVKEEKSISKYWKNSFFPLITSYGGDYLLLECDIKEVDYGMIYLYSPSLGYVDQLVTCFDSKESMFNTVAICFESQIFKYNISENILQIDYDAYFEVAKVNNPNSEYWK
ncbi:MAG: hypothetical protein J0M10_18950 [Chitinophagales bacterium]|nr:hypothetical protein [Chitinophagales bacterium]